MATATHKKAGFGDLIGKVADRVSTSLQMFLLVVAIGFMIAWAISPVRERLEKSGYFDHETALEAVGLALILTLGLLTMLSKKMGKIASAMEVISHSHQDILDRGVGSVYPHLLEGLQGTANHRERILDVLGLTLYTAWPHIQAWINNGELRDWVITLHCLDPVYIEANQSCFSKKWIHHAQAQIEDIEHYQKHQAALLAEKAIRLELRTYRNFPAVHGFRIGNGDTFISFSWWESLEDSAVLADPYFFYERFRPSDRSSRAHVYRALFDNWIDQAAKTSK